jgi:hypothetical protein
MTTPKEHGVYEVLLKIAGFQFCESNTTCVVHLLILNESIVLVRNNNNNNWGTLVPKANVENVMKLGFVLE